MKLANQLAPRVSIIEDQFKAVKAAHKVDKQVVDITDPPKFWSIEGAVGS